MRPRTLLALVPLAFAVLTPGVAAADPPIYPILPNQYFNGMVNGSTAGATVYTVCPGPSTGQTGHPAGGQNLSVARATASTTADVGFTGSAGNSIAATPVSSSAANGPVVFTAYYQTSALPTAWVVPCDGDGLIAFTPLPGSFTAHTDTVKVHYVNIAQSA
jgi:hypothetical protein